MRLGLGNFEEACACMGARNPSRLCGLKSIALLGEWLCPFIDSRAQPTMHDSWVSTLYTFLGSFPCKAYQ
jgi:hypothetical protein